MPRLKPPPGRDRSLQLKGGQSALRRHGGRQLDDQAHRLWWSGINLLSVAIYCADSRAGKLMLLDGLTGQESNGHDWYNLLTSWGLLEQDTVIARWMRAIAWLMCVGSIVIAVWSALQQARDEVWLVEPSARRGLGDE